MTTYAKATISNYPAGLTDLPGEWLLSVHIKSDELVEQGKTDGIPIFIDANTVKRVWIDQAAAEEWITVIAVLDQQYQVVRTVEIVDNV